MVLAVVDDKSAIDAAVFEGILEGGAFGDASHQGRIACKHTDSPAMQPHHGGAQLLVDLVVGIEAHAVGRVGDKDAAGVVRLEFADGHLLEGEAQSSRAGILLGILKSRRIDVKSRDSWRLAMSVASQFSLDGIQFCLFLWREIRPFLESELIPP